MSILEFLCPLLCLFGCGRSDLGDGKGNGGVLDKAASRGFVENCCRRHQSSEWVVVSSRLSLTLRPLSFWHGTRFLCKGGEARLSRRPSVRCNDDRVSVKTFFLYRCDGYPLLPPPRHLAPSLVFSSTGFPVSFVVVSAHYSLVV